MQIQIFVLTEFPFMSLMFVYNFIGLPNCGSPIDSLFLQSPRQLQKNFLAKQWQKYSTHIIQAQMSTLIKNQLLFRECWVLDPRPAPWDSSRVFVFFSTYSCVQSSVVDTERTTIDFGHAFEKTIRKYAPS